MAKFIFKMQKVLDIKYRLEDQAKAEYAIANKEYLDQLEILEELKQKKIYFEEKLRSLYSGKLIILEISSTEEAIKKTEDNIKEQKKLVSKAEKKVEKAREKLNEAMSERKMYESLREKAFEEFLEEIKSEEDRVTDEIVSYRFGRKATGNGKE